MEMWLWLTLVILAVWKANLVLQNAKVIYFLSIPIHFLASGKALLLITSPPLALTLDTFFKLIGKMTLSLNEWYNLNSGLQITRIIPVQCISHWKRLAKGETVTLRFLIKVTAKSLIQEDANRNLGFISFH